jgi:photosystem II stability/assembly factor-like uncharacterized protein
MVLRLLGSYALVLLLSAPCGGDVQLGGWVPLGGVSNAGTTCLSFDGATRTLLAGTIEGFLYYDTGAQTWTAREDTGWIGRTVQSIRAHPGEPGTIVTGRVNAFFKGYLELTEDWGVTSNVVYSSQGGVFKGIAVDPFDSDVLYACGWHDITPGDLLKSTSGGQSWEQLSEYLHYTMTGIAMDRRTQSTLYVSGDEQVTRSTDAGQSWAQVAGGLPPALGVYCVAASPHDSLVLLASNDNGIYRTTDGGGAWVTVDTHDSQRLVFNPVVPDMAVAVTFSPYALLLSTDGGATWTDRTDGFSGGSMVDAVFSADGRTLYLTSVHNGVFSREVFWQGFPILVEITRSGNLVQLSWSTGYPFPYYNVYRSTSPLDGFVRIATTAGLSYEEPAFGQGFFYYVTGEEQSTGCEASPGIGGENEE